MQFLSRALLHLALVFAALGAQAQDLLPVPAPSARVIDQTATLGDTGRAALEQRLQAIEQGRGSQVVVLMVATTQPEDIASYTNRVANSWKIGRRDLGDGLLVVVAKNDRKVRIEVAKALEGAIPDLAARQIIDEAITPRFRQGDFAGGLLDAVNRIDGLLAGEKLAEPTQEERQVGIDWMDWGIFLFIAIPILAPLARRMLGPGAGALATGTAVGALAWILSTSWVVASLATFVASVFALFAGRSTPSLAGAGHSHGWTASSDVGNPGSNSSSWDSGGSFDSGGGGDFGGGGASGDW